MKGTTVEQSDLVGAIKEFPIEVVQEMVNEQVRQVANADVGVFQERVYAGCVIGGFDWSNSVMGADFWYDVLYCKRFDIYFQKNHKNQNKDISKIMKKEEKKTEKKVVVSKEKYDKLVAENDKLEFNNANLEKALCNQKKALTTLSGELLRLQSLIENHNNKWFSRKIKF